MFQNRPLSAPRAIAVDNNTVILQSTSATSVHQSKPSTVIVQAPPSVSTHSSGSVQVTNIPTTQLHPQIIGIVTSNAGGNTSLGNIITSSNPISTTVISRVYGTDGSTIITTAPSGSAGTTTTFYPVATSGSFPTAPGVMVQQSPSHSLPLTVVPSNMVLKRPGHGSDPNTMSRPTTVMIAVTSTANPNDCSSSKRIKLETPNIQIVTTGGGPQMTIPSGGVTSAPLVIQPPSGITSQALFSVPSSIILTTAPPTPVAVTIAQSECGISIKSDQEPTVSTSSESADANRSSNEIEKAETK